MSAGETPGPPARGPKERWLERGIFGLLAAGLMWWAQNLTTTSNDMIANVARLTARMDAAEQGAAKHEQRDGHQTMVNRVAALDVQISGAREQRAALAAALADIKEVQREIKALLAELRTRNPSGGGR